MGRGPSTALYLDLFCRLALVEEQGELLLVGTYPGEASPLRAEGLLVLITGT